MPNGFCKSEEGVKAYTEIGQPYDMTLSDQHHERFEKQSKASPHSSKSSTEVIKIRRVLADDGNEYIVYDEMSRGYDNLGNPIHSYRPLLGTYPIPIPRRVLRMGPDMTQKEVVAEITSVNTGYSIPFSKQNMEKIHKNANDKRQTGATQYYVQRGPHSPRTVTNYEAMKEGDFVQLEKFGMTLEQWTEQQKALTELKTIAEQAKEPEEAKKAAESLAEAGESVPPSAAMVSEPEEEEKESRRGRSSRR